MSNEKLTKKLQGDITKVLKDHMPEYVCGVVKERLEDADRMEKEIEQLTASRDALKALNVELEALKLKAEKLAERETMLNEVQATLDKREEDMEKDRQIFELQTRLEAANVMKAHTVTINENLTKNVERRRHILNSEDIVSDGYQDQYGGYIGPNPTGYRKNSDHTVTESANLEGEM